jgi:hypothetical protein
LNAYDPASIVESVKGVLLLVRREKEVVDGNDSFEKDINHVMSFDKG